MTDYGPKGQIPRFIIISFTITWIMWGIEFLCTKGIINAEAKIFHIGGLFGPFIAGLSLSYKSGKGRLVSLLSKGLKLKAPAGTYLFTILFFPLVSLVSLLIQHSFSFSELDLSAFGNLSSVLVLFVIMLLFAPVGEEFGWRGFMLEKLQLNHTPIGSAILVGLVWGLWHVPLFFIPGMQLYDFYKMTPLILVAFPLATIPLSIIYTWTYNRSEGSIFIVILLHCMTNWSFETFYPNNTISGMLISYLLITLTAVVIFVAAYKNWTGKPKINTR